jgi:hypothetical protein
LQYKLIPNLLLSFYLYLSLFFLYILYHISINLSSVFYKFFEIISK